MKKKASYAIIIFIAIYALVCLLTGGLVHFTGYGAQLGKTESHGVPDALDIDMLMRFEKERIVLPFLYHIQKMAPPEDISFRKKYDNKKNSESDDQYEYMTIERIALFYKDGVTHEIVTPGSALAAKSYSLKTEPGGTVAEFKNAIKRNKDYKVLIEGSVVDKAGGKNKFSYTEEFSIDKINKIYSRYWLIMTF